VNRDKRKRKEEEKNGIHVHETCNCAGLGGCGYLETPGQSECESEYRDVLRKEIRFCCG
jgi:hypothetical protein